MGNPGKSNHPGRSLVSTWSQMAFAGLREESRAEADLMTAVDAARGPAQVRAGICDVSALAVLVATQRRAGRLGIAVRLACPRPQMARLLRVTGLDQCFTICATLDDALPRSSVSPNGPRCL
jgi:hypothetical protein